MPPPRHPSLIKILGTCFLVLSYLIVGVYGRITLESVRRLKGITRECRELVEKGKGHGMVEGGVVDGWRGQQLVLGGGDGDGSGDGRVEGIEDVVSAALHTLGSELLVELEKPLLGEVNCTRVKGDFDGLLRETTLFLYAVQERQMRWRWGRGSEVKGGLEWLQQLWASRRGNSQDRSFIEQQLALYGGTGCFKKLNREVLRKDIEVVEYLNDLIDMFG
ncbi:hypothetical protein EYC84_004038 [Monilinia fructicola]|uniref:Uncharacterized protein n=1 Tax=Monilinia fructicola TaxID=38448 RepID=A0A5M9K2X3_MONFR|nr:hypothetical protein EYC84_004038 [Monilinia fructicola]